MPYIRVMITIISATHRSGSASLKVAQEISRLANERGIENQIWDFQSLPQDFLFSNMFGQRTGAFDAMLEQFIHPIDQIIWVVPEYNGSFPGVTKLVLDAVPPKTWQNKWSFLVGVSSGAAGNLRGQEHLTGVMHYLKMHVHYFKPKLSAIEGSWTNGEMTGRNQEQLISLLDQLKN